MSKYNFPEKATIGDLYHPAAKLQTKEDAAEYLEALVDHCVQARAAAGDPVGREKAIAIQKSNIGYFMGYYDADTAKRVYWLIDGCVHPIFGTDRPDAKEAFAAGVAAGSR